MEYGFPRTRKVARVLALDETGSTNDAAARFVAGEPVAGEPRWTPDGTTLVVARRQTEGKGRLGRTWVSEPGRSFTGSFVCAVGAQVAHDPQLNGWLPMIAGLAVLDALRATLTDLHLEWRRQPDAVGHAGHDVMLKWPNDIMVHGAKLGGILAQMVPLPGDDTRVAMIFGVGLNLDMPAVDLPAGSVSWQDVTRPARADAPRPDPDETMDAIAAYTVHGLEKRLWQFGLTPRAYAQDLRRRVLQECWTLGRPVVVHYADGSVATGTARSIGEDASLAMVNDDGVMTMVHTADVGILPSGD